MPAASKAPRFFLCAICFLFFLSLPSLIRKGDMDSLDTSFTIEVDGKPITSVGESTENRTQATTGSGAAVFTLKNGRLQSGNWILGRAVTENRSFLPKQVYWFKSNTDNDKQVQRVTAHKDDGSYQLKFASAPLITRDGNVFADLQGGEQSTVAVKLQE